ncbi:hypothetical protein TPHA_0N01380 [Tetrapisispora phaffii CBS 4417]|uniref:Uncharacterized protein n=1 Tax=Tetrapisispora phaffii (strain ATCC 24235 / CBS 4417 / NBRC 1672 / NRRL Y-8282 / UCD 70-5) TaxID=1071381 RepID=G8C191_TETPH|nr:hypothetical protein TPHA_0N01380 [Tetrapisispora phaffii CBS 4417]CCE65919.1 hypothetical protein TPHA_0N01380 [Tetrapisispora phaffii CBS 4417]
MYLLSKLDSSILQFNSESLKQNVIFLSLNNETDDFKNVSNLGLTNYSTTIELPNNQYIAYHLSNSYSILSLYALSETHNRRKIHIELPNALMHEEHTLVSYIKADNLEFEMILKTGMFLRLTFPIESLLNNDVEFPTDWFTLMNPYDFSIRLPHLLYKVSDEFSVVFLKDGGLLGLKRTSDDALEPILFSDESYLRSLSSFFSSKKNRLTDRIISCVVYHNKFLIVLTENYKLKIWNLEKYSITAEYDLAEQAHLNKESSSGYESIGSYLKIFDNILTAYLPFFNGIFQLGYLSIDNNDDVMLNIVSSISSNLPSSSLWSLVDFKIISTLDLSLPSTFFDIVVLWKSGSTNKLQILNIENEEMDRYNWYETTNKTLEEIKFDTEVDNSDLNKALVGLQSRYPNCIFEEAENILIQNNISIPSREVLNAEYLANLETLLKDIKSKCDQASSISILNDEIIVINCQQFFNHSVYKINSSLEKLYYNINSSSYDDNISRYLMTIYGFSATISPQVLTELSNQFLGFVTKELPETLSPNQKLTEIFNSTVKSHLETSNINILFHELKSFDVISLLNTFIDNHLHQINVRNGDFISSLTDDTLWNIVAIKSLYNQLVIQHDIILRILLTFTLLDFDYSVFEKQLDNLIELHYKQSLYLSLFGQDKDKFLSEVLLQVSKYKTGVKFNNYNELFAFTNYATSELYSFDSTINPFYMRYINDIVVYDITSSEFKREQLLKNISWKYYIRNNADHELFIAMLLFRSNQMEKSYEFFQLHNYAELMKDKLPVIFKNIDNDSSNIWRPLLSVFCLPYRNSAFFYELSVLFANHNHLDIALKSIKKSLEFSSTYVEDKETHEFKVQQLTQFLDLLINFRLYGEALDVLRLGHDVLNTELRETYFRKLLLINNTSSDSFFSNLLRLCFINSTTKLFLSPSDIEIIDNILTQQLHISDWSSYKKLYSFRIITKQERKAAEILYDYTVQVGGDDKMKMKCYTMIGNVLNSFADSNDKWILYNGEIITVTSIKNKNSALTH